MDEINVLFAIEAEELITEGRIAEAISLCERGLEIYPDYAAAVAILAHAYSLDGDSQRSQQVIEKFSVNIIQNKPTKSREKFVQTNSTDTFVEHVEQIEPIDGTNEAEIENEIEFEQIDAVEISVPDDIKLAAFYAKSANETAKLKIKKSSENLENSEIMMSRFYSDANNRKLAPKYRKKLVRTISIENDEFFKLDDIRGLPVTETYANILIRQGNFSKAKAIYRELIKIQPEKEQYFESKISEIN
jgi:tetratricopeptide (TPR) repeat protein